MLHFPKVNPKNTANLDQRKDKSSMTLGRGRTIGIVTEMRQMYEEQCFVKAELLSLQSYFQMALHKA